MQELGSTGNNFTCGGTRNNQWIQCKLNRCFGNPSWISLFPNLYQWFLVLIIGRYWLNLSMIMNFLGDSFVVIKDGLMNLLARKESWHLGIVISLEVLRHPFLILLNVQELLVFGKITSDSNARGELKG